VERIWVGERGGEGEEWRRGDRLLEGVEEGRQKGRGIWKMRRGGEGGMARAQLGKGEEWGGGGDK